MPVPLPESPVVPPSVLESPVVSSPLSKSPPLSPPMVELRVRSASEPPPKIPPIISEEDDFSMSDTSEHYEYMSLNLDEVCAICLRTMSEPFMDDPDVTLEYVEEMCRGMPCRHCFHKFCIYKWLKRSPTCPVCRRTWPELEAGQENV